MTTASADWPEILKAVALEVLGRTHGAAAAQSGATAGAGHWW